MYAATHAHIEADLFFAKSYGDIEKIRPEDVPVAHQWCQIWTHALLRMQCNVVVANTFATQAEMEWYINIANELQARLRILEVREGNARATRHPRLINITGRMRNRWEACQVPVEIVDRPVSDADRAASVPYQCQLGVCTLETPGPNIGRQP